MLQIWKLPKWWFVSQTLFPRVQRSSRSFFHLRRERLFFIICLIYVWEAIQSWSVWSEIELLKHNCCSDLLRPFCWRCVYFPTAVWNPAKRFTYSLKRMLFSFVTVCRNRWEPCQFSSAQSEGGCREKQTTLSTEILRKGQRMDQWYYNGCSRNCAAVRVWTGKLYHISRSSVSHNYYQTKEGAIKCVYFIYFHCTWNLQHCIFVNIECFVNFHFTKCHELGLMTFLSTNNFFWCKKINH